MKSKKILLGGLLIAGILITTIGIAAAYGMFPLYITIDPITDPDAGDLLILSGTTNLPDDTAIDTIGNPHTGDLLILSGTTSLPIGTDLMVQVIEEPGTSGNDSGEYSATGTAASARVVAGAGGLNRWSVPIDTSVLRPDTYRVDVSQMTWDQDTTTLIRGDTSAITHFDLTGEYLGTDQPIPAVTTGAAFIRLDSVGTRQMGDQFLITGSTNLPVGSDVIWQVIPTSLSNSASEMFPGMMANSIVTRGDGEMNRVSYALDTTPLQPGIYSVTVSTIAGELGQGEFEPGDVAAFAELTLQ